MNGATSGRYAPNIGVAAAMMFTRNGACSSAYPSASCTGGWKRPSSPSRTSARVPVSTHPLRPCVGEAAWGSGVPSCRWSGPRRAARDGQAWHGSSLCVADCGLHLGASALSRGPHGTCRCTATQRVAAMRGCRVIVRCICAVWRCPVGSSEAALRWLPRGWYVVIV